MANEKNERSFPWERAFAANMEKLRKTQDMSQNELARRLNERGLPFHQATVQRVETHERSVRLDEAHVIASVLGASLDQMTQDSSQDFQELVAFAQEVGEFAFKVAKDNRVHSATASDYSRRVRMLAVRLRESPSVSGQQRAWLNRWERGLESFNQELNTLENRAASLAMLKLGIVEDKDPAITFPLEDDES